MKTILIYNNGDAFALDVKVKEFESEEKMIDFVNDQNIGKAVIGSYTIFGKIEIEPFEKVVNYRIK